MNEPALICAFSTASLAIKKESDEIIVSCFLTHSLIKLVSESLTYFAASGKGDLPTSMK